MKIIHCADVHLGSRMGSLPKEKAEERAREIRATFDRLVKYARDNSIKNVLLAGDIFDDDRPFKKDKESFYRTVKSNPDINFYYLRGNHDGKENYTEQFDNLKTFGEDWTAYMLGGNVCLHGIEITAGNRVSLYSSLKTDPEKLNIVMLHGTLDSENINLTKLKNKDIDYLALGHIHSFKTGAIDARGAWAYSGCLEGRGFDETGEKGFIVYDTEKKQPTFVPFARRTVEEQDVDISGAKDNWEALEKVMKQARVGRGNLLRLNLIGEVSFVDGELASEAESRLADECYLVSVKDNTHKKADYLAEADSKTLRGEFIRLALAQELSEDDRQKIIDLGLKALTGNL